MMILLQGTPPADPKYLEAIAAIVAAVIALPIGILVEKVRAKNEQKAEDRRRELAAVSARPEKVAVYLETIAQALAGMIEAFRQDQIPREQGHLLVSALDVFQAETRSVLGEKQWEYLIRLRDLAEKAETIDNFYVLRQQAPEMVNQWVADAQASVGELRAAAARLRLRDHG